MSFVAELRRRNVIRVAVFYAVSTWLVLQVIDVVGEILALPDWLGKAVLLLLVIGFVPALLFAWVFEMTPEGLKREKDIVRDQSITHVTARKLDIAVILLLLPAVGLLIYDRMRPVQAPPEQPAERAVAAEAATTTPAESTPVDAPDDHSIAVLPFLNLSSDPEQAYFSDGLAESLLHLLAQVDELQVAARTSSFRFRDHDTAVVEIARQLKVAHVLEGSVRRAGNTVRVTAQLIKADDGFHLWSGTYDRPMDDIFAIQDEIASHVAEALKVALLGDGEATLSSRGTEDLAAYEAYLRGRQLLLTSSHSSLPEAERYTREAIGIDPDYVLAWISLGEIIINQGNTGLIPFADMANRLEPIAERLLELEPESAPAQAMLGWVQFFAAAGDGTEQARPLFLRAYERDPDDPFVALQYATFLDWTDDDERAIEVAGKALERDPMSVELHQRLGYAYLGLEASEQALFHARRTQALEPDNPNGWSLEARILGGEGKIAEALVAQRKGQKLDPDDYELPANQGMYLLAIGALDEAEPMIDLAIQMKPDGLLPQAARAAFRLRRGEAEAAGELLLEPLRNGIEGRQWGYFVVPAILREFALATGRNQEVVDLLSEWFQMNLGDPAAAGDFELQVMTWMAPMKQAAGDADWVSQVIARAESAPDFSENHFLAFDLAVARQDVEALVPLLEARVEEGLGPFRWLFLETRTLDFAADDSRIQAQLDRAHEQAAAQRAAWDLLKDEAP